MKDKIKITVPVLKAGSQANGDYISEEALEKAVVASLSVPKALLQHSNEQINIEDGTIHFNIAGPVAGVRKNGTIFFDNINTEKED